MKLSKKGAVTLATALVVFLVTTDLMLSRVKDLESSYDEQSKQMQLLKDEYNSLSNELSAEKSERTKYQRLYDEVSIRNEQLEAELEN
jgi:chromosome segregation ATPase|nr:MAG TPA: cell division protein [Caudoviricetes sp.]